MQIDLSQMMAAREARAQHQQSLLKRFGLPLIVLTLNIPGPEKSNGLILDAFSLATLQLQDCLAARHMQIHHHEALLLPTGPEGYFSVSADAGMVKALCVALEERDALGRLMDLDVLDRNGSKLARDKEKERGCLVCGAPGRTCAAGRLHDVSEIFAKAMEIITEALCSKREKEIAGLAVQALLFELAVTPKPGLVDRCDNGAHQDMNCYTFLASAPALFPYFQHCARLGRIYGATSACFTRLRTEGLLAEGTMFRATQGVNTHKGAIFTLGILCACAGHLTAQRANITPTRLSQAAMQMTARSLEEERRFLTQPVTFGEQLMTAGLTGARAEAAGGFPSVVHTGLPALRASLANGKSLDEAGVCALLSIMRDCQDTVLLRRAKGEDLSALFNELAQVLKNGCQQTELLALNQLFIKKNLSPGGSADLLAASFFFHLLTD